MRNPVSEKYARAFDSPTGRDVLADLEAEFYAVPRLASPDPTATIIAAAQRDVVQYILDMIGGRNE